MPAAPGPVLRPGARHRRRSRGDQGFDGTRDDTTFLRGDSEWATPSEDGNSFATGVDLSRAGRNLSINVTGNSGFTALTDTVALPDETHVDSGTISGTPPVLALHLSDGTDVTITGLPEGTTEWIGLTDTPSSIVANDCVKGNVAGTALSFGSCGGGGGGGGTADGKVIAFTATASGPAITFTVEQNEGISNIVESLTLDDSNIPNLPASKITTGEFGTDRLADDAVTQAKLANNSVHAAQIGANAVGTSEISANAVGTSELSADAVTNANLADDSVHNDQLASNSVRADEIQANAVGHVEMQDDSVGVDELITTNTPATSQVLGYDGSDMLWVAQTGGGGGGASTFTALSDTPGTITASECVQGNAAGNALVFAACATGGGGGGTDDQTAAEVPVTATGFSGNLSGTDTDVQTALATIDGLSLGAAAGEPAPASSASRASRSRTWTTSPRRRRP